MKQLKRIFEGQMYLIFSIFLLHLNDNVSVESKSIKKVIKNTNTTTSWYDSWNIVTDNPAVYDVIPLLDLEALFATATEMKNEAISRVRRGSKYHRKLVFKKVGAHKTQNRPFSSTVRVSSTCTGSLISPRHVLTAAHCVHDHKRPKYKLPFLKVGFLQRTGKFHWIKVTKMFVPRGWKNVRNGKHKSSKNSILDSDFAVLRLKRAHGRPYFKPAKGRYYEGSRVVYNSFPSSLTAGRTMWHSSCGIDRIEKNIMLTTCIASPAISGSNLYQIHSKTGDYVVTGVISALIKFEHMQEQITRTIATKFDSDKLNYICQWTRLKWLCQ